METSNYIWKIECVNPAFIVTDVTTAQFTGTGYYEYEIEWTNESGEDKVFYVDITPGHNEVQPSYTFRAKVGTPDSYEYTYNDFDLVLHDLRLCAPYHRLSFKALNTSIMNSLARRNNWEG